MAPKAAADDNASFLYLCYQHAGSPQIDFNGLGSAMNLEPNAARMRFHRLRDKLEQSLGTTGYQVAKPAAKPRAKDVPKKRPHPKEQKVTAVEEPITKRQTRGKTIDFSAALDSDSEMSRHAEDGSDDAYDAENQDVEEDGDDVDSVMSDAASVHQIDPTAKLASTTAKSEADGNTITLNGKTTTPNVTRILPTISVPSGHSYNVKPPLSPSRMQLTPPPTSKSKRPSFAFMDTDVGLGVLEKDLTAYKPGRMLPIDPDALYRPRNAETGHPDSKASESTATCGAPLYSKIKASSYVTTAGKYDGEDDSGIDNTSDVLDDSVPGTGIDNQTAAKAEPRKKPPKSFIGRLWGF